MEPTNPAPANPGMHYLYHPANDACPLAFQSSLPIPKPTASPDEANRYAHCILLLHGFSGSSAYFARNYRALSERHWVVAPDLRGHGNSGRGRGGYHVARLAADVRDLLAFLRAAMPALESIVPVGCSIGAAVLWTYVELFGSSADDGIRGFVFVDQAPLQDRSPALAGSGDDDDDDEWGPSRAHLGCYDEATMRAAQREWTEDPAGAHAGLVRSCLGYRHIGPDDDADKRRRDEEFFTKISERCDHVWLARLLADHTRYDHREAIEMIEVPTLVLAGRKTGCFPLEGMEETVRRVERRRPGLARMEVFEAGHWLFYEEPERFNRVVGEFVDSCVR